MNVRLACAADLPAILALNRDSNPHPWAEQHFSDALNTNHIELVEHAGAVLAFAVWQSVCDEAELHLIVTDRAQVRQGAASALLEHFVQTRPHIRRVLLEVRIGNTAACALYARHGFIEIARRKNYYLLPIEDALIMEKIC
ncbi:MAG: ribosomal protein S18-alanine N-acetyltransferase [Neisseria sp.]|nr:ribosomal protein S18-alanine N-acetyltransferase [Neisseria sp.]